MGQLGIGDPPSDVLHMLGWYLQRESGRWCKRWGVERRPKKSLKRSGVAEK